MRLLLPALACLIFAINVHALHVSRSGRSTAHHIAFVAGIVGLCSPPVLLYSFLRTLPGMITARGDSPLMIISFVVLLASTAAALLFALLARRQAALAKR